MNRKIRIGSRDSKLAVIQANLIKCEIEKNNPGMEVELVTMKTTGDLILHKNLDQIGGKGLFVKELDIALLENRVDITVHSLKDMPMIQHELLPIIGYSRREDPRDGIIFKPGSTKDWDGDWSKIEGIIGSSSKRRTIQLQRLLPKCTFQGIRGNVQTRLRKLEEEPYEATVLAAAGLKRLHLESRIGKLFSTDEILPAAGQGILAVQGRKGEDFTYLHKVCCEESRIIAQAERSFVRCLDGGCSSPVAAYATKTGTQLQLQGLYYEEYSEHYAIDVITGEQDEAEQLGERLANRMRKAWEHV
ncbi:MAG: hydroxymethylbilane synthase [Lachnospiraceae bacterium]|nr:hydroxymethylbilane synthase [Lachnospiraceae bacterium]